MSNPENPLLAWLEGDLPPFDRIKPEHVRPAIEHVLAENRRQLANLLDHQVDPTWETLITPLEAMDERLHRVWGPVHHLNAVMDSKALRPVHQWAEEVVTRYQTELAQNKALFEAIRALAESRAFHDLSPAQKQTIKNRLRDFRLQGVHLSQSKKARFKEITLRLAELGTRFEQNVLDASLAFKLHVHHAHSVAGMPETVLSMAKARAQKQGKEGWLFTLDPPSYLPFMQFCPDRALRRTMYEAYVTRASRDPWDNTPLMQEILRLRKEAAHLLGFPHYAALSLQTKMAPSPEHVVQFLYELARRSRKKAQTELEEMREYAARHLGLAPLEAWDLAFVSERMRKDRFGFSSEDLRSYFPESRVIEGLRLIVGKLFGLNMTERKQVPTWHENVRFFDLWEGDRRIAGFYFDPYAREGKRAGAWMDECIVRWKRPDGHLQLPVAYLVCNFASPADGKEALWTHDEVITLLHEFGHSLHHMLTEVETLDVSGIRGVAWDAVEFPSQFMENFGWHREALCFLARHHRTGEPIPDTLIKKMLAARNFQSGMATLRQVEFALFDFLLHYDYDPNGKRTIRDVLDEVRRDVAVFHPPSFNRFENSFSHIFAGGYAAGYYSYKWAEVMAADAFEAFEEAGIFDPELARALRDHILAQGGARDMNLAYKLFRGRPPAVSALLRQSGIEQADAQAAE